MVNALKLLERRPPVRMLVSGYPKSGKTGAVCSLLASGYKVRLVAFEPNYQPILDYTDPKYLPNLDIITCQDHFKIDTDGSIKFDTSKPKAFDTACKALKEWKYVDEGGVEINLGSSKDWGPDTVLVIDSLTANSEAMIRKAQMVLRSGGQLQLQDYGFVVDEQMRFLQMLARYDAQKPDVNGYHLIVIGHLQMLGPKEVDKKADQINKDIQTEVAELLPTRLYPIAATKNYSMKVTKDFPTAVIAETVTKLGKVQRILSTVPREEVDVAMPALSAKATYPIETGYAEIFAALGHVAPAKA